MIKESIYCNDVMKKHFKKTLGWLKKKMKILKTLLNIGSVTMIMLIMMLRLELIVISLRKFRDSAHRDRNVNIKLNHKIRFILHNLKEYDSTNLIMQEIGTFNLKINVIPNGLEKKYEPYHQ